MEERKVLATSDPDRQDVNADEGGEEDVEDEQENKRITEKQQEEKLRKKYGGLLRREPALKEKEERTFFDSADWALGKSSKGGSQASSQGNAEAGSKGGGASAQAPAWRLKAPAETLRPKLQPTPHHPVRRHSFADQVRFKP